MRIATVVGVVIIATSASAAPPPEATALFDQGIKDMRAGNLESACHELAASLAKYPDSGTEGALAQCYTKAGKLASAWNLWRDLADTERDPRLRADAGKRASALESRVPHFMLKLVTPRPGMAVTVGENRISDLTLQIALPIDPGPFVVHASAAQYQDWSATFDADEGRTTTVEIPALTPVQVASASSVPATPPEPDATPRGELQISVESDASYDVTVMGSGGQERCDGSVTHTSPCVLKPPRGTARLVVQGDNDPVTKDLVIDERPKALSIDEASSHSWSWLLLGGSAATIGVGVYSCVQSGTSSILCPVGLAVGTPALIGGFIWAVYDHVTPHRSHTKVRTADALTPFAAPHPGGAVVGISGGF
jgi:hypothetical protein